MFYSVISVVFAFEVVTGVADAAAIADGVKYVTKTATQLASISQCHTAIVVLLVRATRLGPTLCSQVLLSFL